mmetsp:Transcript_49242/g.92331  ORF Transcript_49242/g.92331 Transcript_49242/m.92331 type:complete len:83 (-) Transcript_49242:188-436(-)
MAMPRSIMLVLYTLFAVLVVSLQGCGGVDCAAKVSGCPESTKESTKASCQTCVDATSNGDLQKACGDASELACTTAANLAAR